MQIHLPPPTEKGSMSLEEAITRRRSTRNFTLESISQSQLSQMLWATQGVIDIRSGDRALEIFVVCGRNCIEGISDGIYHYNPESHSLTTHRQGDFRQELARAALEQEYVYQAPLNIIICTIYERTTMRYGARGERYVHIEVGHAGQNIYLQATALGLATVAIGAFHDEQVREALRLDKRIKPLYIMPVGKPG
jgi:SagB-type dehydrogenase family enzyme